MIEINFAENKIFLFLFTSVYFEENSYKQIWSCKYELAYRIKEKKENKGRYTQELKKKIRGNNKYSFGEKLSNKKNNGSWK